MALTRKMLKALGIEDEKADQIIEEHVAATDALKAQRDALQARADEAEGLREQLAEAKGGEDFAAKYAAEHKAFEAYKAEAAEKAATAEKTELYRSLLAETGVDAKRIPAILKLADLSGLSVKDGRLDKADELAESIKAEWGDFIAQKTTEGANVAHPPATSGNGSAVTAEGFRRMSIRERQKLYDTDRETYNSLAGKTDTAEE